MMKLIQQLKCAFQLNQRLEDYYASLTSAELQARRSAQFKIYLSTSIAWSSALIITLIAAKMSLELTILYTGVIIALLITNWRDYRHRLSLIDRILNSK